MDFLVLTIILGVLVASFVGVRVLSIWPQGKFVDTPNARSSHVAPMPRGGGLVVVVATVAGGSSLLIFAYPETDIRRWVFYSIGVLLVAGVGLIDDFRSLSKETRLATHTLAAVVAIIGLGSWRQVALPGVGTFDLAWLGWPITFLWIVGLTNAYNFMDGIDGIAAGQAIVAGLGWGILELIVGNALFSSLGFLLAASSLGFLCHNWPPAKIFMGDVGSTFFGYTFAVAGVVGAQSNPRLALIGILFVWPFVFDAVFTFFRRLLNHENVFLAHRTHLYQRLVIMGFSHRFVTVTYIGLAVVDVLLGIAWYCNVPGSALAIWFLVPLSSLGLWAGVVLTERKRQNPV